MRIVVSLTTLPKRLTEEVIIQTLESINNQTITPDAIYLGLPKKNKRLNVQYPNIPKIVKQLCTTVLLDEDYGPVTKILAGLKMESDPNTIIITIDDDYFSDEDLNYYIKN